MAHPYETLGRDSFWRAAVAERSAFEIKGLWKPRFQIKKRSRIATAGSCFAQHISRALTAQGYSWIDAEPAPEQMTDAAKRDYHYGIFSFRTGNIYTTKMLHQWLQWASSKTEPPQIVWEKEGRFYDPFRPAVELNGFATQEEVFVSRQVTIAAVRRALKEADFLVFTLGLTEAWQDTESGIEFAICPGVAAGEFDAERHSFVNHGFQSTYKNLKSAVQLARRLNPRLKVLLTVSPVPLTATASGEHVLTATSLSKSVLRAVAEQMKTISPHVDYFPSYEIITQPAFRGMFFDPNMRTVTGSGVGFVMESFFRDQADAFSKTVKVQRPYGVIEEKTIGPEQALPKKAIDDAQNAEDATEALLCEEEMLNAFGK